MGYEARARFCGGHGKTSARCTTLGLYRVSFAQKRQQIPAGLGLVRAMALDRCPARLREEEGDALTCGPRSSAIERGRAQAPETERERARGWTGPPAAAGPQGGF